MADDFVWMKHPEGTEAAPFAVDAAEFWQARGWEPVEKPAEPDPTAEPRRAAEWPHSSEIVEKVRAALPHIKARTVSVTSSNAGTPSPGEPAQYEVAEPDADGEAFIPRSDRERATETTTGPMPAADTKPRTAGRQRRAETEER